MNIVNTRSDLDALTSTPSILAQLRAINSERADRPAILAAWGFADDAEFDAYVEAKTGESLLKPEPTPAAPEPTEAEQIESLRADLLAQAAARRWEVETGGITVDGVEIRTDRESQAMLSGAITFCDLENQAVINWKAANGWEQIEETGLRAIALAVGRHIQEQFTIEAALAEAINAATDLAGLQALESYVEEFEAPPES